MPIKMFRFLTIILALILIHPLALSAQWTNLGTQSMPFTMTSDYHGIRITNVPGPTPSSGSTWTSFKTDDDWVTGLPQSTGGGGSLGCCTIEHIDFLNDSIGFAEISNMGFRGVHRTTDAGATWQPLAQGSQTSTVPITDLQAFSDTVAYIIGHGSSPFSSLALRFTPSGYQSVYLSSTFEGDNARIHFVSDTLGFVIVRDSNNVYKVLRTIDGGLTWATRLSVGIGDLRTIQFLDPRTGFVAGASGVCYKTVDGGDTWNSLAINGPVNVYGMHFLSDQIGYLSCGDGVILRTTNGGQNWFTDQLDSNSTLVYVRAVNATIAYAMNSDSVLFKRNYIAGTEGESALGNGIQVYPNPTNGRLNIALPPNDVLRGWQIWDLQGKLLLEGKDMELDIAGLPSGLYLLQVQSRLERQTLRVQMSP
jgi:photosystem II stability/assembly factor-like uncharacterized protein